MKQRAKNKNNSKKKRHYFGGCTIDLSTLAENEKQKLEEEMTLILKKYNYADEVKEFVEAGKVEADLYNRFKDYYSYVFYIAKKK